MHLKAVHARYVSLGALGGDERRVDLEDDVVKRSAKVGAIDSGMPGRLGVIYVLTARTVQLYGLRGWDVGEAHGEQRMGVAHHTGTFAEVSLLVFLELAHAEDG